MNRMRDKNYVIISTEAEKTFEKNSTSFHNKNSQHIRYRENVPQHDKGHIGQA